MEPHYDKLYSEGGFKYNKPAWLLRMAPILKRVGIQNHRILDAPCGDGFFSDILRILGNEVVATDLSKVGVKMAGGTHWNLEEFNPRWENKFDWVFSRAITHIHYQELNRPETHQVFQNFMQYAPKCLVIYATDEKSHTPQHYMHRYEDLDRFFDQFGNVESFVDRGYYHAVIKRA